MGKYVIFFFCFAQEESDLILDSADKLSPHEEVGLLRAVGRFSKIFSLQLPLTRGHVAHLIIGP